MNATPPHAQRIETLLTEIESMAGPTTWVRVEELVRNLMGLYGSGLERLVELAQANEAWDLRFAKRLCEDELVSSLLLLHGLHPLSPHERIERALEKVRPYLGSHGGAIEWLGLDEKGTAHLRLDGSCRGCPSSRATIEGLVRRAVEEAAPEVQRIEVEGVIGGPSRTGELVQLQIPRTRPRLESSWHAIPAANLAPGSSLALTMNGTPLLLLREGENLFAYRDRCPACGKALATAERSAELLRCGCGTGWDFVHGGSALTTEGPPLEPLPLLEDGEGCRVALPEAKR